MGCPAGFFAKFEMADGKVKSLTLEQGPAWRMVGLAMRLIRFLPLHPRVGVWYVRTALQAAGARLLQEVFINGGRRGRIDVAPLTLILSAVPCNISLYF